MVKEATSLKLEKEVLDKAKDYAKRENRSVNNFIETVLIKYFEQVEKNEQKSPAK
jgi:hypothetical protein